MLDPKASSQLSWEELSQVAHRMVDDLLEHTRDLPKERVWRAPSHKAQSVLRASFPEQPQGLTKAYEDYLSVVRTSLTGNAHPRFFGWMMGGGTLVGALADFLAAGTNVNAFGGQQAATMVELQVLDHFKELFGLPKKASGLMLSGASMANLVALVVARHKSGGQRIYGSDQTHVSIEKAARIMGLADDGVLKLPSDRQGRLELDALKRALDEDLEAGRTPLAIVANAGVINTGAIDELEALGEIASARGVWLHVDGAVGAAGMLSERLRPRFSGMERADSIAFDMHKWLQIPYEAGCLLVADPVAHRKAFSCASSYLARTPGGLGGGRTWFNQLGPELSRGFKALKVWMALKTYGTNTFGQWIDHSVELTEQLSRLIEAHPRLELLAPPSLCIVCFRYERPELDREAADSLNLKLAVALQEKGLAVVSATRLQDRVALRAAVSNHRTSERDIEALVRHCVRVGDQL